MAGLYTVGDVGSYCVYHFIDSVVVGCVVDFGVVGSFVSKAFRGWQELVFWNGYVVVGV